MSTLTLKQHLEKNVILYFSLSVFIFSFILAFNKFYENKIKYIELFDEQTKKWIQLENNKISFVYLVNNYNKSELFLLNVWTILKVAKTFNAPVYFLIKGEDVFKFKSFLTLNDINQKIYLTNRLIFWEFAKGPATLLIFKRNRLIYSEVVKNLNQKAKIEFWEKIVKDR